MKIPHKEVIIVGAGLAGLSCARRLMKDDIPFLILEADQRIGGRLKTDRHEGFILNHGFQVLQTAYPEARRVLDYDRLALRPFAPGAIIRIIRYVFRIFAEGSVALPSEGIAAIVDQLEDDLPPDCTELGCSLLFACRSTSDIGGGHRRSVWGRCHGRSNGSP